MTQEIPNKDREAVQLTPEKLAEIEKRVQRAEALAKLLDDKYLDPLLGLWEGAGDAAAALAGCYIIYEAQRAHVSSYELAKMLGRTTMDFLVGDVPIVGDIFDFFYKSNKANAEALRSHFEKIRANAEVTMEEGDLIERDRGKERADLAGRMNKAA